ncbi:hypothetical protein PRVXH_002384 [Proteinivorax hydrogeniformans]|uniref:Uncharacterized protein n=1 Tax=Proteinivorax hydrogeniformans TaxID=1826727 RepID=A0AAU8HSW2_9FIRM
MKKKILKFILVFGIGYLLLSLMQWQHNEIQEAGKYFELAVLNRIFLKVLIILFGVLIEWRRVIKLFKNGFSVDVALLVLSCILIVVSIIPVSYWFEWFGIAAHGPVKILQTPLNVYLINVVAGIALTRSLAKD